MDATSRRQRLIGNDLLHELRSDYDRLVRLELAKYGYIEEPHHDDLSRQLILHDKQARLIEARPYRVYLSRELTSSPYLSSVRPAFDEFIECLRAARSVAPFLSKSTGTLDSKDHLLMHWGLHHAHLSSLSTMNAKGFVKRPDHLVFFRVQKGNAYLVDIVPHTGHGARPTTRRAGRICPGLGHELEF